MIFTDANVEKLKSFTGLFKTYNEIRNRTRLEKILAQEEKKFSDIYKKINLKRSNEINPLTACAHGTRADAILSGIIFSDGQLLPLNEIKKVRVLDVHNCRAVGNQNFVSTVHLKNVQDFRNEHQNEITAREGKRKQIIYKNEEISFEVANNYAQEEKSKIFDKDVFLNRIKKRCEGKENIYNATSDALDDDVLKFFEELSKIHVIALGHGIGKFEGDLDDYRLTWNKPRETLFERFNISIIAVKKEHRELVEPLTKINPDFNIAIIDQEELLKFTKEYNAQFYDKSITDEENEYYNTECDNTTSASFMEALVSHFKLPLTFSEEIPPVTIIKRSIYKNQDLIGRFDKVSYCIEGLEQKQKFYDERQVKSAVSKGEKIDDYDPIVYALVSDISLDKKFPTLYAMEKNIKIEGIDPTLWAQKNKYRPEGKEPIVYAVKNGIKIENKDPILWAQKNKYKIDKMDPIVYAIKGRSMGFYHGNVDFKIEGIDATKWIDDAIKIGTKIEDTDAEEWIRYAVEKAIKIKVQDSEECFYRDLISYAMQKNITIEGIDAKDWMDYANRGFGAEKNDLNAAKDWIKINKANKEQEKKDKILAKEDQQCPAVEIPSPTIGEPTTNTTFNQQLPIKVPAPAIEQPQQDPIVEVPSPALDTPTSEENPTPKVRLPEHEVPVHKPASSFTNGVKPQTDPQKSGSSSKYYKIGGAGVGLAIGLAIAYFAGAAALTPVHIAVAVFIGAAICSAALGVAVGACLSCLSNTEVSNLSELER